MTYTTVARQPGASPIELFVNLSFSVQGQALPADHGYGLLAALSRLCPAVHQQNEIQILTIPGIPDRKGKIALTDRSRLLIRLPITKIPLIYAIAGKRLLIGKHSIQIGIPNVEPLQPKSKLRSRIVVITGYQEPESTNCVNHALVGVRMQAKSFFGNPEKLNQSNQMFNQRCAYSKKSYFRLFAVRLILPYEASYVG